MNRQMFLAIISITILATQSGCVSMSDVNESFRRLDRAWSLEYQKTEDEYRYRIVDGNYTQVIDAVRNTFLELGLPLEKWDYSNDRLIAQNNAPNPLTLEEWRIVAENESPRMKEIAGPYFYFDENPKDYVVTVLATVKQLEPGKTLVILDYELDAPKYRAMGFHPSKVAPPTAVQLASIKFWNSLQAKLTKVNVPPPRRRNAGEIRSEI